MDIVLLPNRYSGDLDKVYVCTKNQVTTYRLEKLRVCSDYKKRDYINIQKIKELRK